MSYNRILTSLLLGHTLASCSDALVFGDRSSIEVASVRLNDDVAEPIRINIGMDRQLVTSAPAIGGVEQQPDGTSVAKGEAINLFSSFRARVQPAFVTGPEGSNASQVAPGNELMVHTRFASGATAKTIASDNPGFGAQLMGQGLKISSYPELATRALARLKDEEKIILCRLSRANFDALTPDQRKEAGILTGAHSHYNKELHGVIGRAEACRA